MCTSSPRLSFSLFSRVINTQNTPLSREASHTESQHLDEGKNRPGERNLYPFPEGSRMGCDPGLLPVEAVGEGATLLGSILRWPLGGFLCSSATSWLGVSCPVTPCRGERFRRPRTSRFAVLSFPPRSARIGPECCCWVALAQKVLRLWIAWTFSSIEANLSRSISGASAGLERVEPVEE